MRPGIALLFILLFVPSSYARMGRKAKNGIIHFLEVEPGVFRGGQPGPEDWAFLKAKGVRTVVKLDLPSEGSDAGAEELGMAVIDASGPPADLGTMMESPDLERIRRAVTALGDPKLRPIFVHCLHGQDRTGLVVGLYRVLYGHFTKEKAYREMRANGFHRVLHGLHEVWERFDGKTLPSGRAREES